MLLVIVVSLFRALKTKIHPFQKIFLQFFISSFLFNVFIYLNTEFIFRYLVNILVLVVPCVAIMMSTKELTSNTKYAIGVLCSIVFFTCSFATMQSQFALNANEDKVAVRDFLLSQDYQVGYGTFWNANVFNYLTNGKIDMGNIDKANNEKGVAVITREYEYDYLLISIVLILVNIWKMIE